MFGAAAWWIASNLQRRQRYWAMAVGLIGLACALGYSKSLALQSRMGLNADIAVGLGSALLCIVVVSWSPAQPTMENTMIRRMMIGVSEYSYSLYLIHFPVVMLVAASSYTEYRMVPDAHGFTV